MNLRAVIVGLVAGMGMAALAHRTMSAPLRSVAETATETTDGGADADAAVAIAEVPFALVAEGAARLDATQTSDGRIVLFDGPTIWEAKPDGTIAPIVPLSESAKLVPDDETVVGYSTTHEIQSVHGALDGTLVVETFALGSATFAFAKGKLGELSKPGEARATRVYRGHPLAWDFNEGKFLWADGADLPLPIVPSDVSIDTNLYEGPHGSLVAIVARPGEARNHHHSQLLVWTPASATPTSVPFPPDESRCDVIPSFADRFLLECGMQAYALEGDRLVVAYNRTKPYISAKASEDPARWMYVASENRIERCPPQGECTSRAVPNVEPQPTATYVLFGTEFVEREGARTFQALDVETPSVLASERAANPIVEHVFARAPNDVWLIVRVQSRTQVFHTSAAPPAKPMMLPGVVDARVALRNTRPPGRWTGSCDQLYVRLGSDADAIVKRGDEIARMMVGGLGGAEPTDTIAYYWALVEGTIGDERGVGVVLMRHSPADKLAPMETAARKLVKAFATGPANEPAVYCTLPVLERKLFPLNY